MKKYLSNIPILRFFTLFLLRKLNFEFRWTHDFTKRPFYLHTFKHKGYWYYGKNREKSEINCFYKLIKKGDKVLEVGAIGVPDSKSTEAVKVYIVKKDQSLTEQEIIDHCKDNLTGYKRPKHVAFSEELPKSNVGKILRRLIKEEDARVCSYD